MIQMHNNHTNNYIDTARLPEEVRRLQAALPQELRGDGGLQGEPLV